MTNGGHGPDAGTAQAADAAVLVAGATPGYAVEDFNYPQADKILAEQKITLKRGDGHITLANCVPNTGQLRLLVRNRADEVCFNTTGNQGWLTLDLPGVYSIRGNDYSTTVDMTVGTEEKSYEITKNTFTPVGESTDPESRAHTLVEIRTAK